MHVFDLQEKNCKTSLTLCQPIAPLVTTHIVSSLNCSQPCTLPISNNWHVHKENEFIQLSLLHNSEMESSSVNITITIKKTLQWSAVVHHKEISINNPIVCCNPSEIQSMDDLCSVCTSLVSASIHMQRKR